MVQDQHADAVGHYLILVGYNHFGACHRPYDSIYDTLSHCKCINHIVKIVTVIHPRDCKYVQWHITSLPPTLGVLHCCTSTSINAVDRGLTGRYSRFIVHSFGHHCFDGLSTAHSCHIIHR